MTSHYPSTHKCQISCDGTNVWETVDEDVIPVSVAALHSKLSAFTVAPTITEINETAMTATVAEEMIAVDASSVKNKFNFAIVLKMNLEAATIDISVLTCEVNIMVGDKTVLTLNSIVDNGPLLFDKDFSDEVRDILYSDNDYRKYTFQWDGTTAGYVPECSSGDSVDLDATLYSQFGLKADSWCLAASPSAFTFIDDTSSSEPSNGTLLEAWTLEGRRWVLYTPSSSSLWTRDII